MGYTDRQIKNINEQATARPGHKYVTNSGVVYEGTVNNRLKEIKGIDTITIKKDIKVAERLTELESDIVLKEYTADIDRKIADAKCFTMAMAIVL